MALPAIDSVSKVSLTLVLDGSEQLQCGLFLFFDRSEGNAAAQAVVLVPIYRFLFSLACDWGVLLLLPLRIIGHRGGL